MSFCFADEVSEKMGDFRVGIIHVEIVDYNHNSELAHVDSGP